MADDKQTRSSSQADPSAKAVEQAHAQTLSPEQKRENYLADLERAHKESVVDSLGHTPRAG